MPEWVLELPARDGDVIKLHVRATSDAGASAVAKSKARAMDVAVRQPIREWRLIGCHEVE